VSGERINDRGICLLLACLVLSWEHFGQMLPSIRWKENGKLILARWLKNGKESWLLDFS
jgi:hypothetical protein